MWESLEEIRTLFSEAIAVHNGKLLLNIHCLFLALCWLQNGKRNSRSTHKTLPCFLWVFLLLIAFCSLQRARIPGRLTGMLQSEADKILERWGIFECYCRVPFCLRLPYLMWGNATPPDTGSWSHGWFGPNCEGCFCDWSVPLSHFSLSINFLRFKLRSAWPHLKLESEVSWKNIPVWASCWRNMSDAIYFLLFIVFISHFSLYRLMAATVHAMTCTVICKWPLGLSWIMIPVDLSVTWFGIDTPLLLGWTPFSKLVLKQNSQIRTLSVCAGFQGSEREDFC